MTENDVLGFDPQDLFKEDEKSSNTQKQGNTNVYHMRPAESTAEDGVYRATIKVVYNPFDRKHSFLKQQTYGLNDVNGFFSVVSKLTVDDKECPIFKAWKKCRYAKQNDGTFKTPEDKTLWLQQAKIEEGGRSLFDKRQATYCVIQILSDDNHPELVGSFKLWKIPASIYQIIQQKQAPTDPKKSPIPVMDFLFGRAIDIEVHPGPDDKANPTRKTREITYTGELSEDIVSCVNPDGSPLLTSAEQDILDEYISDMKKVWKSKDAEERTELTKEVMAAENTTEFRKIYARVLEQIKTWTPNLDTLSYHDWSPEVMTRVQNWINVVLAGGVPTTAVTTSVAATETSAPAPAVSATTATVTTSTATVESTPADDTSDLPF